MAYAVDLKSTGLKRLCEFESRPGHQRSRSIAWTKTSYCRRRGQLLPWIGHWCVVPVRADKIAGMNGGDRLVAREKTDKLKLFQNMLIKRKLVLVMPCGKVKSDFRLCIGFY